MPLSEYMQERLGSASISLNEPVVAGSFQCFELIYTAGFFGVDDSGSIKVVWRFATDIGTPQFENPAGANYVSVDASNGALLAYHFDPKENIRPWGKTLYIKAVKGNLQEGDRIRIRYGDPSMGSPGMRMQTFCEDTLEFRVLVDAFATYDYVPLRTNPTIRIVPGEPVRWKAVLPTVRRVGEPFGLRLKTEDRWGNPSNLIGAVVSLKPSCPVRGLPETLTLKPDQYTAALDNLSLDKGADLTIRVLDSKGDFLTDTNPLRIIPLESKDSFYFWGDLHGQSEETIGTNSVRDYFSFARDRGFLDICCHQGNDFQITGDFWEDLQQATAEFNEPGRLITFPGYEWSGNTGLGGDHNIIFKREGEQIHRSSHALIYDQSDAHSDRHTTADLFEALKGRDVMVYAHVGGRYANLSFAPDPPVQIAVEIHSAWGTFEWLLHDAFKVGMRVGIVANSDDHKGRMGASYPGSSLFGSYGGLTCFLCPELTRNAVFDALRRRHHYATTGARIYLNTWIEGGNHGERGKAIMGDSLSRVGEQAELHLNALTTSPIQRIDVFNGTERTATWRPTGRTELGSRICVLWEGAEYRGRGRETIWDGSAVLEDNAFEDVAPINFWNPERPLRRESPLILAWKSITTGGISGFTAHLADGVKGQIRLDTPLVKEVLRVEAIGSEDTIFEAGGLGRRLRVFRLPDRNDTRSVDLEWGLTLEPGRDNPIYIRLTQEDGHMAWSSPIYLSCD